MVDTVVLRRQIALMENVINHPNSQTENYWQLIEQLKYIDGLIYGWRMAEGFSLLQSLQITFPQMREILQKHEQINQSNHQSLKEMRDTIFDRQLECAELRKKMAAQAVPLATMAEGVSTSYANKHFFSSWFISRQATKKTALVMFAQEGGHLSNDLNQRKSSSVIMQTMQKLKDILNTAALKMGGSFFSRWFKKSDDVVSSTYSKLYKDVEKMENRILELKELERLLDNEMRELNGEVLPKTINTEKGGLRNIHARVR